MNKIYLGLLSVLLVFACDAQTTGGRSSPPKMNPIKAFPVVAVSGSDIKINGTPVWFGDTLESWKRVLGGSPACYDEGIVICVWHANGLSLGTDDKDKTRVKFMVLSLTIEPAAQAQRGAFWPTSPFRGTLDLDGISINNTTIFRDISRRSPPARQLRCGDRGCGNPIAAFSDGANIHMTLVRRSETSPIREFSIACTSTNACIELIPGNAKK